MLLKGFQLFLLLLCIYLFDLLSDSRWVFRLPSVGRFLPLPTD